MVAAVEGAQIAGTASGIVPSMKGSKCKCGFATTSTRTTCPRCGREMETCTWKEQGKVLSFVKLQVVPLGLENPHNSALVEIDEKGPKVICWTTENLDVNDPVSVSELNGKYFCVPVSKTASMDVKA